MQYSTYDQIPWYRKNWFAVLSIFIFPPALLPVLLTGETYYQRKGEILCYSKIAKGFLLLWGVFGIAQIGIALAKALGDSADIRLIKGSQLGLCPGFTVEQLVDGYMVASSWDSGTSDTEKRFVNIDGDVTYEGKPVRASIQFQISGDDFTFNAIELNGVPSPNALAVGLLTTMCQAAENSAVSKAELSVNKPAEAAEARQFSTSPISSEIAGTWANDSITMTIETAGDYFNVAINVGTAVGCAGEINGRAKWMGKHIMLEAGDESSCVVQITPENRTIWLGEEGCSSFHGTSCGFDGELKRQ